MESTVAVLETAQMIWGRAARCDLVRPRYAASVGDNLFLRGLNPATEKEFEEADGSELRDTNRRPAKMRALISSSALAVNFFDPWRYQDNSSLGPALGLSSKLHDFRFEYVCRDYPVGPRAPNLDLLLSLVSGQRVAVEAKFSEPFRVRTNACDLPPKYHCTGRGYWETLDLPKAQRLVAEPRADWKHLNAPQLLKHLLGIAADGCADTLLYLWYDTGLPDARKHRREIEEFAEVVSDERIRFFARTYQETFDLIRCKESVPGWAQYMSARYFGSTDEIVPNSCAECGCRRAVYSQATRGNVCRIS